MTLDQLVQAAGQVGLVVTLDKLGVDYIAWLNPAASGDDYIATPEHLVGAQTCDLAIDKMAQRLAEWLREAKPDRYEQALKFLHSEPPGRSVWERVRNALDEVP